MLRLGATQVKQVAHRAPNENPSRAPAMPDATPQLVYMTCRAFMRRSADLTGGRRASLRSSARTCARRRRCQRFVDPGFRPCSLHRITFRFRAAVGARIMLFPCANPERGVGGAPGGAHWSSVTLARRDNRVGDTRRIPLRPGRRHSALHRGDFRPRDHASTPAVSTGSTLRLARRPDRKTWPTGSRTSRAAVRTAATGRHSPLRLWIVSGDAPHERDESCVA